MHLKNMSGFIDGNNTTEAVERQEGVGEEGQDAGDKGDKGTRIQENVPLPRFLLASGC
jgi:hypothetical protein